MGLQGQIDSPGILEDKAEEAESQGGANEDREAAGTETDSECVAFLFSSLSAPHLQDPVTRFRLFKARRE